MSPWKSPGPDGFPAGFYQVHWNDISTSFCSYISHLWNNPSSIYSINTTDICLIPKVDKPILVSQFRPISLCNVSYKVLTKILVQRLKPIMPTIVSPYQTGFIPTRSIHDNILVAQELVHSMHKMRGNTGFFAIKVDLAKAYDRLKWSFIHEVIKEVGFPSHITDLIMSCVSGVQTNVLWNGNRSAYFNPGRGIRQGDPMSPYLFVLCMDKLTHLILDAVDKGDWVPIKAGRRGPSIPHLMFADDLLLFGKATDACFQRVLDTLNKFCSMSGQLVSMEKTSILFFKNVPSLIRRRITRLSNFRETTQLGRYLGVPLIGRAPKRTDFQYLIDKVNGKLSSWKAKHLSFAGRVTLSKSVIQAIPIYSMMTFPIPKICLQEIQKLQRNFIWGSEETHRKFHMVNWKTLALPKHCGGLAIRNLINMNKACSMKLGWAIKNGSNNLWCKVLIGKYDRNTISNGDIITKPTDSFIWKSIANCWEDISRFEVYEIGNGTSINVWHDIWLNQTTRLSDRMDNIPDNLNDLTLADITDQNENWNLDFIKNNIPEDYHQLLLDIPPPRNEAGSDIRLWADSRDGQFSIASAYNLISGFTDITPDPEWQNLWRIKAPERIRCFTWQVAHGRLPTRNLCSKWNNSNPLCKHCPLHRETLLHVLRDCPKASVIWCQFLPSRFTAPFFSGDLKHWVLFNFNTAKVDGLPFPWTSVWASTCYHLWRWRNCDEHDPSFSRPSNVAAIVLSYLSSFFNRSSNLIYPSCLASSQVFLKWLPPDSGWVKLNCDGASRSSPSVAACGGVLRDSQGRWIIGYARKLGMANAYLAEIWGVFVGLQIAADRGVPKLEVNIDSQALVLCLNGSRSGNSIQRNLLRRIHALSFSFRVVKFVHAYRETNGVADGLANLGCSIPNDTPLVLFPTPPDCIKSLLDRDSNGVLTPRLINL